MTTVGADHIVRFRAAIVERLGLQFDEDKSPFLGDVLHRRCAATGRNADQYLSGLETAWASRDELHALGSELTVAETYFFRHGEQFRACSEIALPERVSARANERRLHLLSLGCASGEEAYSLAMLARDVVADPAWEVSITGVDVNPTALEKGRRGRFSAWALRGTPERERQRWFRQNGREFVLDPDLRAAVRFDVRNLVEDDPSFWRPNTYDVVFCRNVLMYFVPEQARLLIARIARTLCPGGYLFLGHAETLRGLSNDFHLHHTHGTFYYQRKEAVEERATTSSSASPRHGVIGLPDSTPGADTWFDVIRRASDRVAALTDEARQPIGSATRAPIPGWDPGVALELLRHERFSEALASLDHAAAESRRDPDVLLLRAVLLVHKGQLAEAEQACAHLLTIQELNAGAQYLLALCHDAKGDRAAALHHDQVASYLDPAFAMPRLHMGLLARRAGDGAAARRELSEALVLLEREDASRVLLFGGGFGRHALIALCQAELRRAGALR